MKIGTRSETFRKLDQDSESKLELVTKLCFLEIDYRCDIILSYLKNESVTV